MSSINLIGKIQLTVATTAERMAVIPMLAEPIWDETLHSLFVGDGVTYGGIEVSGDTSHLEAQIIQLQDDLADEIQARIDGDTTLQTNITNEENARILAINALESDLNDLISSLALVATTGSYNDLTDKPVLGTASAQNVEYFATAAQGSKADTAVQHDDLATVATTGSYNDLLDKPSIPAAQVNSDWNAISGVAQILNKPNLATIATSGQFTDILGKPTTLAGYGIADGVINTRTISAGTGLSGGGNLTANRTLALNATSIASLAKADTAVQPGSLATVATTGSYNDLIDKPSIPQGTVTSIGATVPTGLQVSGSPITNSGTLAITYAAGYQGFTTAESNTIAGIASTYIPLTQRGANNGVATLGNDGKIPTGQLPNLAITDTFVVNSQVAMLALTVERGDIAVRSDISKSYINSTGNNGSMSDWVELLAPPNAVLSVNGQTGTVVLSKSDVGLGNVDNTSDANKPISTATQTALNAKANNTVTITAGTGLTGGGNLTANRTVALSAGTIASLAKADTSVQSVTAGSGINIDNTDPLNPIVISTSAGGSVTSVALSAPTGFSVSGSPVTSTGTLALTYAAGYQGFTTAESSKLAGIATGAQVNVATNLAQGTRTTTTVPITSSTGTGATLAAATTSLAGVMSSADKTKLDGIASGATVGATWGTNLNSIPANITAWAGIAPSAKADASHTHTIANVIGLQGALDDKVNKTGDTITGVLNIIPSSRNDLALAVRNADAAHNGAAPYAYIGLGVGGAENYDEFGKILYYHRDIGLVDGARIDTYGWWFRGSVSSSNGFAVHIGGQGNIPFVKWLDGPVGYRPGGTLQLGNTYAYDWYPGTNNLDLIMGGNVTTQDSKMRVMRLSDSKVFLELNEAGYLKISGQFRPGTFVTSAAPVTPDAGSTVYLTDAKKIGETTGTGVPVYYSEGTWRRYSDDVAVGTDPIAKEPAFSKGSLVAGAGVSLSGTLTDRLVGSGNITITATSSGTVTSVNLANSTGLTASGGPVTGAGSLTYTLSANLQAWHALATNSKQDTLTSSTSNTVSGTQVQRAALTGDVTATANSNATTISNSVVTNAKLANVATATIKGRVSASTGVVEDLTAAQVRTLLNVADGATANTGTVTSITAGTGLSGGTITTSGTIALNATTIASLGKADTAVQPDTAVTFTTAKARLLSTTITTNTTATTTHCNAIVKKTNTSSYNFTINSGLGDDDDTITVVNAGTTGNITIVQGSGVTIYSMNGGTTGNYIVTPMSKISLVRVSSTVWVI